MTQALYRKWRPQTFDEVVGQEHVVRTLRNALLSGQVHHAYLFAGPRGTGKTTTARLLAKAVNCLDPEPAHRPCNQCAICRAINEGRLMDLIEMDAASNTSVEDVRELRERVGYRPSEARYKVYIIDEVHMLSTAAFNALLKTLEEPPAHAIFVLATTEPHRIPATVLSRCQRLDFRRVPLTDIVARLRRVAEQEGIRAEEDALSLIARHATGSMRDAESLLDQLAAYTGRVITVEAVRTALGTGDEGTVLALADALAARDAARGLAIINDATDRGTDPRQLARQMTDHLRALMMVRLGAPVPLHIPDSLQLTVQSQAARFTPRQLTRAVRLFGQAATDARAAWQPQLPLELAFLEAALPEEAGPPGPALQEPPARREPTAFPRASPSIQTAGRPTAPAAHPSSASPPPPAPPPGRESPSEPAAEFSLEEVTPHWNDLLRRLRSINHSLAALMRDGKPVNVEGGALLIGFPYAFHRDKVNEETNRRAVEDALTQLLGRPVRVRCVLLTGSGSKNPAHPTLGRSLAAPSRPSPPQPSPPAGEDGLIQAAVEKLGARVVKNG
ncbi:MAG: DNA polymerase III subunit gamma/tau [Anaerolineae bacterium]|nr:DNA polymerase III subunit gamma/tau [Anaerolineae bacterium]MDW8069012.1 DNA polymerase III subunit gamma/tau [Anaerolineae bacterium]